MVSSLGSSESYSDRPLTGSRLGEPHLAARVLYRKQLFWTFRILEMTGRAALECSTGSRIIVIGVPRLDNVCLCWRYAGNTDEKTIMTLGSASSVGRVRDALSGRPKVAIVTGASSGIGLDRVLHVLPANERAGKSE